MRKTFLVMAVLALAGCRQARVSDEATSRRDMIAGDAIAKAADRGYRASPARRGEATKGAPMPLSAMH